VHPWLFHSRTAVNALQSLQITLNPNEVETQVKEIVTFMMELGPGIKSEQMQQKQWCCGWRVPPLDMIVATSFFWVI
jgi:hypothetical protein